MRPTLAQRTGRPESEENLSISSLGLGGQQAARQANVIEYSGRITTSRKDRGKEITSVTYTASSI